MRFTLTDLQPVYDDELPETLRFTGDESDDEITQQILDCYDSPPEEGSPTREAIADFVAIVTRKYADYTNDFEEAQDIARFKLGFEMSVY